MQACGEAQEEAKFATLYLKQAPYWFFFTTVCGCVCFACAEKVRLVTGNDPQDVLEKANALLQQGDIIQVSGMSSPTHARWLFTTRILAGFASHPSGGLYKIRLERS